MAHGMTIDAFTRQRQELLDAEVNALSGLARYLANEAAVLPASSTLAYRFADFAGKFEACAERRSEYGSSLGVLCLGALGDDVKRDTDRGA